MISLLEQPRQFVQRHTPRTRPRRRESAPRSVLSAIGAGVAGAVALTLVHESARHAIPHAPRVDVIGVRALSRPMRAAGYQPPRYSTLHNAALAGELVSNSAYYSLVGVSGRDHVWRNGAILGLLGGLGAALLPPVVGLGNQPHRRTPVTQILTVGWYLLGGLAAAATYDAVTAREE